MNRQEALESLLEKARTLEEPVMVDRALALAALGAAWDVAQRDTVSVEDFVEALVTAGGVALSLLTTDREPVRRRSLAEWLEEGRRGKGPYARVDKGSKGEAR